MVGSVNGNIIAVLYFLLFQVSGYQLMRRVLGDEKPSVQFLGGSVLGSMLLQWMPILFAFVFDFTRMGHVAAAIVTVTAALLVKAKYPLQRSSFVIDGSNIKYLLIPYLVFCVFEYLVFSGFEIRDGVVYSSQATYGDMSMHLGFITSIAEQQTFPPQYSILPGTKLSYPFLSDSISSSLYIWGCDIRLAYMLPMLFAGAQVMCGAWLLFEVWLKDKSKTLLAWVLFFLNGGFGFVYFLNGEETFTESMKRLFTGFYQTPTNLVDENIRWVNMIVDMLLPQRATLFGYAVLFFALYLLYRAVWQREKRFFAVVGLLGGALPMIHTHSFLALVLVSGGWLLMALARDCDLKQIHGFMKQLFAALIVLMQLIQLVIAVTGRRETDALLFVLLLFALMYVGTLVWLVNRHRIRFTWKPLLGSWGVYLIIAAVLALPQLFVWTFGQATGEQFLRGYFNWANIDDNYLWFYVKNLGVVLLMFVPAYFLANKKNTAVAFPILIIWLIAELAVFQPNVYDNNKLLYVAYLLMCGVTADFMVNVYRKIKYTAVRKCAAAIVLFLCTISAILTIGRECVAEYQLMEREQVQLAEYVAEHTEPKDKILTNTRHNNIIAALTGRNIQCGSGSYLYYHGLDYRGAEDAVRVMYEEPSLYPDIFEYYEIDFISVSPYERHEFSVDEEYIAQMYPCVYENADVKLYRVKE